MKLDIRDVFAFGGLSLASLGVMMTWGWPALTVLGAGLFYLATRRA